MKWEILRAVTASELRASHFQLLQFICSHLRPAARQADKLSCTDKSLWRVIQLLFNRNLILLLKNRIKFFCWLSYLSGFYCYLHLFSPMQELLTMHIIGFSWRGVGGGPLVSKFPVFWGISGASFGYLASQIYGQESLLIIWFTAYWDKEFHTAIWTPGLVYFKGVDFQAVLWESNAFHTPHVAHTKTILKNLGY